MHRSKTSLKLVLAVCVWFGFLWGCPPPVAALPDNSAVPSFHIGIATGTPAQGADDFQGALEMIRLYGDAGNGGMVRHITYPDNFTDETGETVALITALADDPAMKLIVV
ncbi:MAG: DUF3798 domain-containing protein, partial [Deltaproteobacteria bacterium]|nr:DUF3798 domain-containing protein [Deltaproteobacteria bacterium]